MSSSDSEIDCKPVKILEAAESAAKNLLSIKSKHLYENSYRNFSTWKKDKKHITSADSLVLYFQELGEKYKPSTLWAQFSMLKTMIIIKENIDIGEFAPLSTFLKTNSKGFQSQKTSVFTSENVKKFLNEAPNLDYLASKVILIFGLAGACRGHEITNVRIDDVQEQGELLLVKILDKKDINPRSFIINAEYTKIVKEYQALRPKNPTSCRFFLNYQKGKCTSQPIGKNKISSVPSQIATYLGLPNPEAFTGHALRRTSKTLLADAGSNMFDMQSHGGWASSKVTEMYIEESITNPTEIESIIKSEINVSTDNSNDELEDEYELTSSKRARYDTSSTSGGNKNIPERIFNFKNCNITMNFINCNKIFNPSS